jgi:putative transposase
MPRHPRAVASGQPLHIVQRGNNRATTFRSPDDFRFYKHALEEASRAAGCAIHAYVLMSNHVHLLATPEEPDGAARMMQSVGRRYVRFFNDRSGRTGTLWEGRYRSALVDSARYLFACSRYIELNPVRAGMAHRAAEYPWSSFGQNAGAVADPIVTPHALYLALGATPAQRRAAYRALFARALPAEDLVAIRRATRRGTVAGRVRCRQEESEELSRRLEREPHGGDRRSAAYTTGRARRSTAQ